MRHLRSAFLYMALCLVANGAVADTAAIEALREGTLKKLIFQTAEDPVPEIPVFTPEREERHLADWRGKYLLVNFWATWCAPCRAEMPQLSSLQTEFGGEDFDVVTIATGGSKLPGIERFFDEIGVDNLPILMDDRQALTREMGILGLPVTVLVDPEGHEIARMHGDAEWNSDSARAIIAALIEGAGE